MNFVMLITEQSDRISNFFCIVIALSDPVFTFVKIDKENSYPLPYF